MGRHSCMNSDVVRSGQPPKFVNSCPYLPGGSNQKKIINLQDTNLELCKRDLALKIIRGKPLCGCVLASGKHDHIGITILHEHIPKTI